MIEPDSLSHPRWRELTEPDEVAAALVDVYQRRGASRYDEAVTQIEHATQCGALALAAGAELTTVVAAFLHDIGHLLLGEHDKNGDFLEHDRHNEDVGGRFLANWFGDEITTPIRLHAPAKRYLVATEPSYADGLSPASIRSLVVQGGPISPAEIAEFEADPDNAAIAVDIRRWDDGAKVPGAPAPTLSYFGELISQAVSR